MNTHQKVVLTDSLPGPTGSDGHTLLPASLSAKIKKEIFSIRRRKSWGLARLNARGTVPRSYASEVDIFGTLRLPVDGLIGSILDSLGMSRSLLPVDGDDTGHVPCELIQAGIVDWHDDVGVLEHNHRLLIPMTNLPLKVQLGNRSTDSQDDTVVVTREIPLRQHGKAMRAFVIDNSVLHRVVLEDGASLKDLFRKGAIVYLDIPLSPLSSSGVV